MGNSRKIAIAILLLASASCGNNQCTSVADIEVSELLLISSNKQDYNYCGLLKKAVKEDENSIKKLSLLQFYDAVGYDHGSVIVDLILLIGEAKYLDAINDITPKEKSTIMGYIDVGLEYGNNPAVKDQTLKTAFPELYAFLNG